MSSIIGVYNNTTTSTCSLAIGQSISTCGSINTQGQAGYLIDWKEDLMKKYPNFTIKTEYDAMSFAPIITVIDNNTNKEYKLKQHFTHILPEETEEFIKQLITDIRETKINNIINGTKD
jgi:hypothetical protein